MPDDASHGRYTAQGEIARGGMGVVLRVQDRNLDRTLAMKRMLAPPDEAGGEAEVARYARFLEEAQVTAQLDHPSIVPIHELGTDEEGRTYYTMRLVKGREFGEVIREVHGRRADGPLTPALSPSEGERENRTPLQSNLAVTSSPTASTRWNLQRALGVMVRVCQAVAYAHGRGVIHRDLKPANVMVGDLGEVYVMDWGLAKMAGREDVHDIRLRLADEGVSGLETIAAARPADGEDGPSLVTVDGAVIGTPAYMPPEQAAGRVTEIEHRSDIYSLGAILYELLVGHPPYLPLGKKSSPREVLTEVTLQPPERVRMLNASADVELAAICEKAMARDPARRYQSCVDLAEDLQAYLDQRVVKAHRTGAWIEARKWIQRNRATAFAAAAALVAIVAGLVTTSVIKQRAAERQRLAFEREQSARKQTEITLADSYASLSLQQAANGEHANAQLWAVEAERMAANDPARERANRVRAQVYARHVAAPVRAFHLPGEHYGRLEFVGGGRWLLAGGTRIGEKKINAFKLLDLESESVLDLGPGKILAVAPHPDGRRLAFQRDGVEVEVRSLPDFAVQTSMPVTEAGESLVWSPDGRWLFVGGRNARLWDSQAGRFVDQVLEHEGDVVRVAFSPDGRALLTATPARVRLFRIARDGAVSLALEPLERKDVLTGIKPQFIGDGSQFLIPARWDTAEVWNTGSVTPVCRWRILGNRPLAEARPLDGGEAGKRAVFLTGGEIDPAKISLPDFGPDGLFLAQESQWQFALATSRQGKRLGTIGHHINQLHDWERSPDGTLAAMSQKGGFITIWRLPDAPLLSVVAEGVKTRGVFSPDSRFFALAGVGQLAGTPEFPLRDSRVFESATGRPAGPALEVGGDIVDSEFTAAGESLVLLCAGSGRGDGAPTAGRPRSEIQFWNWRSGARLHPPVPLPSEPRVVRRHPDGRTLAVLCVGGEILRVDAGAGTAAPVSQIAPGPAGPPWPSMDQGDLRFTADGTILAAWNLTRTVHVLNWPSGGERFPAIDAVPEPRSIRVHGRVLSIATHRQFGGKVPVFWNLDTGRAEHSAIDLAYEGQALAGRFSEDGEMFLLSGMMNASKLWRWRTGEAVCPDLPHPTWTRAEFIPGTPWIISVADLKGAGQLKFWSRNTGRPIAPDVAAPNGFLTDLRISPDGRTALVTDTTAPATLSWINLGHLHDLEHPELSLEDRRQLARLNSGGRTHDGGIVRLSAEEWFAEWTGFRRRHPGFHRFQLSPAEQARWHEHQAERLREVDATAAAWHRRWAAELRP